MRISSREAHPSPKRFFRAGAVAVAVTAFAVGGCKKDSSTSSSGAVGATSDPGSVAGSPLAGDFEGTIALRAASATDGKSGDITFHIKKDLARIDLPKSLTKDAHLGGDGVWLLISGPEKRGYAVIDAQKSAMFIDFTKVRDQASAMQAKSPVAMLKDAAKAPKPDLKKTDKKDTVAGLPCAEWELTNKADGKDQLIRICVAEAQSGWLSSLGEKMLPDDYAFAAAVADGKHFPVRVVAIEGGKETGRVEVTKYTKEPVADALVHVPDGYAKTDLFQMLQSMMQLGGGTLGGEGGPVPPALRHR
jgi:hypothetical protein